MKYFTYLIISLLFIFVVFILAGDYVYRTGTKVLCGVHEYHKRNTPASFILQVKIMDHLKVQVGISGLVMIYQIGGLIKIHFQM